MHKNRNERFTYRSSPAIPIPAKLFPHGNRSPATSRVRLWIRQGNGPSKAGTGWLGLPYGKRWAEEVVRWTVSVEKRART